MADDTVTVSRAVLETALLASAAALEDLRLERKANADLAAEVAKLTEALQISQRATSERIAASLRMQQTRLKDALNGGR